MKVLQINVVYKEKSTGRTCFEVEKFLSGQGDECYTAYGFGDKIDSNYAFKFETKFGHYFHNIMSHITGLEGYFSFIGTRRLIKYVKKIKPDVIHLRNLHDHYVNLPMLFKYLIKTQIPVVITLHDFWIFTGKCMYPIRTGCDKWQDICDNCPSKKVYPESMFFDFSKKMFSDKKKNLERLNVKAVMGVSDWVADLARLSFLNKFKIIRLYNWINLDVFHPCDKESVLPVLKKYGVVADKFTVICVAARWDNGTQKNDDLNLLSDLLGEDCRIIVVGRNSASIKKNNVVNIEFTSDLYELAALYSFSDVYVHLSMADTFGKVIAEAMACGTPAVVYDITACGELVTGGCGEKVEPRNVRALAEKVLKIKETGKDVYTQECLKRVKENFDYKKNMIELREIYREAINGE